VPLINAAFFIVPSFEYIAQDQLFPYEFIAVKWVVMLKATMLYNETAMV
jgi:hypothetical protein